MSIHSRRHLGAAGTVVVLAVLSIAAVGQWRSSAASSPVRPEQAATATPAPTVAAAATATAAATAEPAAEPDASAEQGVPPGAVTGLTLDDLEDYNGIPVGFTDAGLPFMGDPGAPVVMIEYSDYLCPFCGRHFLETVPALIDEYVLTGKLRMVFQDFPIPSLHPNAPQGHVAARCVGEQGAAAYWAMHDQLFGRQDEWNRAADPTDFLADAAEQAGADLDAYQECLEAGSGEAPVEAGMADGLALGFNGTPTFVFAGEAFPETFTLIGAYPLQQFQLWVDSMAAGDPPPAEAEPETEPAQLPFWASADGLAPDPDNEGHTLAGDQFKGDPDAPVTVVEFSDMQCPACAAHHNEVQAALDEQFVDTGKVFWVFKHRPLAMHPYSALGAAATECAADQDMFWEMQDLVFAGGDEWAPFDATWTTDDAEVALSALAKELELDSDLFVECLNSREPLERVLFDVFDSEGIVSATPTFVVLYGGQGTLIAGSRPAEDFAEILNSFLEMAGQ